MRTTLTIIAKMLLLLRRLLLLLRQAPVMVSIVALGNRFHVFS
jgi:hypothetical protein